MKRSSRNLNAEQLSVFELDLISFKNWLCSNYTEFRAQERAKKKPKTHETGKSDKAVSQHLSLSLSRRCTPEKVIFRSSRQSA